MGTASGLAMAASVAVGGCALFLLGGVMLSITGFMRSNDADELLRKVLENKEKVDKNLQYSQELRDQISKYLDLLTRMQSIYKVYLQKMQGVVARNADHEKYTGELKNEIDDYIVINAAFLTAIIFDMCKKPLVLKADNAESENCTVSRVFNHKEIGYMSRKANFVHFLTKNPNKTSKAKNKLVLFYSYETGRWVCVKSWAVLRATSILSYRTGKGIYQKIKNR